MSHNTSRVQTRARGKSERGQVQDLKAQNLKLMACFALVMIGIAISIQCLSGLVSVLLGQSHTIWVYSHLTVALIVIIWATIVAGAVIRSGDVRNGGRKLAKRFGASPINARTSASADRVVLELAAELAGATAVTRPSVWVLRREASINSFVVGHQNEVALVVSQGALDILDRAELRGLIAHEIAHLSSGDLTFNMKLLTVLGGLMAVDELGRAMISHRAESGFRATVLLGYPLRLLGCAGLAGGMLISALFSRQQELPADALGVQIAGDSFGLASALEKSAKIGNGNSLQSHFAPELAPICFHLIDGKKMYSRFLATHPKTEKRIAAIEPNFMVKERKVDVLGDIVVAQGMKNMSFKSDFKEESVVPQASGESGFSDKFELLVSDPVSCLAAVFALFVSRDETRASVYYQGIAFAYQQPFATNVRNLRDALGAEFDNNLFGVVDHVTPFLTEVKLENRKLMLLNLERLVASEDEFHLRNYALLQYIRRKCQSAFPTLKTRAGISATKAVGGKVKGIQDMDEEISLIASLLVEIPNTAQQQQDRHYVSIVKSWTSVSLPRRSKVDPGIGADLDKAFHQLLAQPLDVRQAFIDRCSEVICHDRTSVTEESTLVALLSAALEIAGPGMESAKRGIAA